jgi:hypothetical protein
MAGGTKMKNDRLFLVTVTVTGIGLILAAVLVELFGNSYKPCAKWHKLEIKTNEDQIAKSRFFHEHGWHVPIVLRDGTNIVISIEIEICKTCGIVTSANHQVHAYKLEK